MAVPPTGGAVWLTEGPKRVFELFPQLSRGFASVEGRLWLSEAER